MSNPEIVPPTSSPGAVIPSPSSPPPNTLFRGPNGIRAGWRVAIYLVLVAGAGVVVGILLLVLGLAKATGNVANIAISGLTPLGLSITEGVLLFCTAVPALIMARIERRKFGQYGLPAHSAFRRDFWIGGLVGFLSISGSLLAIFAFHGFHLGGRAIHGNTMVSATAAWGVTFILVGLAEEFSFRGYLQFTLATGMGFWPSAILLSLLFGYLHKGNPGETITGLLSVVLFGLVFCLVLQRTGNLWWAVGFHAGWDWGQTFFYGVPDSGIAPYHNLFNSSFNGPRWLTGGTVGPEASVFTPIVLVIVAFLFTRIYRENRYPAR